MESGCDGPGHACAWLDMTGDFINTVPQARPLLPSEGSDIGPGLCPCCSVNGNVCALIGNTENRLAV